MSNYAINKLYERIKELGDHWSIDPSLMNFSLEDGKLKYYYKNEDGKALIKEFFLEISAVHDQLHDNQDIYLINFFNTDFHRIFLFKSVTQVLKLLLDFVEIVDNDCYSNILRLMCIYEFKYLNGEEKSNIHG